MLQSKLNCIWANLPITPPDSIFALSNLAKKAPEPKADLVVGAYRDENGRPYPLKVVREAERKLLDMNLDYEYLPILGYAPFVHEALKLLYDEQDIDHVYGMQTLSGTGALWVGAQFLRSVYDVESTRVYISDPTWVNHFSIFSSVGWPHVEKYRYYDNKANGLDFEGMKADIQAAPERSIFVLHQCAHNPTGVDPSEEQWNEIAEMMIAKNHQVFFDSAYQGYASGDLVRDSYAARLFFRKGIEFICAQSFSKNMGLYNERVGTLSVVTANASLKENIKSKLALIARSCYSNPPAHGARIIHLILSDKTLRAKWEEELKLMSTRIKSMRARVYDELVRLQTPGSWEHIVKQIGMFSFLGLTKAQSQYCQDHNVFITLNGRANMAGLTNDSALLLAKTIHDAVQSA